MRRLLCGLVLLGSIAACVDTSEQVNARDTMTQRQKDSIVAESFLPGGRVVGSAMKASDAIDVRNARLDSAGSQ
ncbi:MAG TPA: hypothetical protein VM939_14525 [Gemmatimonadaceae bacterium]|nr:hypothetical protein [Gemmatimonadaceae bacterium]